MRLFYLVVLLFLSASAYGEIYTWRDRSGLTHYVNSMDDVPARYRNRVRAMNYGSDPKSNTAAPLAEPSSVSASSVTPPLTPSASRGNEAAQNGTQQRRMKRGVKRSHTAVSEEE